MIRYGSGAAWTAVSVAALGGALCRAANATSDVGDAPPPPRTAAYVLRYRALPGQAERQFDDVRLTGHVHGRTFTFENTQVNRVTFTVAETHGAIRFADRIEKSVVIFNGRREPNERPAAPDAFTVLADGTLAAFTDGSTDKLPTHLTERLFTATTPVFPARAVGVGDRWSHDYAPNASVGLPKAHADFAIVRRERRGGADAFEVTMRYAEDGSGPRIAASGVIWVEIASGDPVDTECSLHGIPLEDDAEHAETTLFDGSLTQRRTEGGPLAPASANASR